DQTGAEKNMLLDLRANREAHPVTGGVSDGIATFKGGLEVADDVKEAARTKKRFQPRYLEKVVQVPDEGIWDQVFTQLDAAHALFSGPTPDLAAAKLEMSAATRSFRDAHHRTYEYKSRTEDGGRTAAEILRGVEVGCDIT